MLYLSDSEAQLTRLIIKYPDYENISLNGHRLGGISICNRLCTNPYHTEGPRQRAY